MKKLFALLVVTWLVFAVKPAMAADILWPAIPMWVGWESWNTDPAGTIHTLTIPATWLPGIKNADGSYFGLPHLPASANGVYAVRTELLATFENQGSTEAHCRIGIGVSNPVAGPQPMYPYLGVTHDRGDYSDSWVTIPPGHAVQLHSFRVDKVDAALPNDPSPIPNWPNWSMEYGANGKTYPVLVACGGCDENGVIARNMQMTSQRTE